MKRLALLFLLLCAAPLFASDANVTWTQPTSGATANSWNVYIGTTSGIHAVVGSPLALSYSFPDGSMTQDLRNYIVVTAVGASGESAKSVEVHGFPRPVITSAVPVDMTTFIRLTVTGFNFSDVLSNVDIDFPGMTIISAVRLGPNLLEIDYTVDPGTPPVSLDLTVASKWQRGPAGTPPDPGLVVSAISEVFPVPTLVPLPPIIMDVN